MDARLSFRQETDGFGDYDRVYSAKPYTWSQVHEPQFEQAILAARTLWDKLSSDWIARHGDQGSCVLGNGFYIAVKPPRVRKGAFRLLVCSPCGQAESAGWNTREPVLKLLQDAGIDCWYECGQMD